MRFKSNTVSLFFFSPEEQIGRWEQQRYSVVNKVVNQWSLTGRLGGSTGTYNSHPTFPHDSSVFPFDPAVSLSTSSHQACYLISYEAPAQPREIYSLRARSPSVSEHIFFFLLKELKEQNHTFPHLNPLPYCYTVFLDRPPHPHPPAIPPSPRQFLTAASGYLVVVAPGAVWLADCGRQLFGGEPIAAVAEVGHPCADGVISGEHTSVDGRARHAARHSCRGRKGRLLTHVHGQQGGGPIPGETLEWLRSIGGARRPVSDGRPETQTLGLFRKKRKKSKGNKLVNLENDANRHQV